jgi:hypothetical protein
MRLIFLDIDGVLNCETFFVDRKNKAALRKEVKKREISREEYYGDMLCEERIGWLNELCTATGAKVVISSTWRLGKEVSELQAILSRSGATFDIIDKTPRLGADTVRGNEIYKWLKENAEAVTGKPYYEFKEYVIIDDDSDMLLWQRPHFFQTDAYSGLTPNTCYKIKRFFGLPYFSPE